ncbi:hypothetical protein [uncultured Friedmanniella sp.]|uniref:hypothetical protein n=1 Tax=uncultured Friedmanniella sp. TaxID=335381 RepID=UPI0035CB8A16
MKRRQYTATELNRLGGIIGQSVAGLVAQVSTVPWYGFNGIQALVLTDDAVYRIQQSFFALRRDRILGRYPLTDISDPRWTPARNGRSGRIAFRVAGSQHCYISKWQEAVELAGRLERPAASA